jgi:hypothetical protein
LRVFVFARVIDPMELIYKCTHCSTIIYLHQGEMSRIQFNKMPTKVLEADTGHKCPRRIAA